MKVIKIWWTTTGQIFHWVAQSRWITVWYSFIFDHTVRIWPNDSNNSTSSCELWSALCCDVNNHGISSSRIDFTMFLIEKKKKKTRNSPMTLLSFRTLCRKTFPFMNGQPARRETQKEQRRRWSERNRRSGWCLHQRQRCCRQWWSVVDSVCKEGIQWS